jgi:hypothetical protein
MSLRFQLHEKIHHGEAHERHDNDVNGLFEFGRVNSSGKADNTQRNRPKKAPQGHARVETLEVNI